MGIRVCPSLLAANPLNWSESLRQIENAGVAFLHLDVMDGHFVPNLSFGLPLIRALKAEASWGLDVHIMVSNPDQVAEQYVDAGADILSFHVEAADHPVRILQMIRARGARAAVAVNPGTSLSVLDPLYPYLDMVNLMSVNPGFGGQSFLKETPERVAKVRAAGGPDLWIQVDGGINERTGREVVRAGADTLVAGTYIFGSEDPAGNVRLLAKLGAK